MKRRAVLFLLLAAVLTVVNTGCGSSEQAAPGTDSSAQEEPVEAAIEESGVTDETAADAAGAEDPFAALAQANAKASEERQKEAAFEVARRSEAGKTMGSLDITAYEMPSEVEDWGVHVDPVEGITDDFILGVDASEVLSIENSGAKYYDYDGTEKDVFAILAKSGVNCIRIRLWNDPYDENGNGYGGGNCDLNNAIILGKRATENGMTVSLDFHYSDFWADPTRQLCPKSWKGMSLNEKRQAVYDFTYDSLDVLLSEGVDISMVQVGNETNFGMSGENITNAMKLFHEGALAVRDISSAYSKDILSVIHFTNPSNFDQIDGLMTMLSEAEVDFDVLGLSYYTYWHGDYEDVAATIKNIQDNYGKKVCLVEYAYPFTSEDGDSSGNSVAGGIATEGYNSSVQSQSVLIRDMAEFAVENGCIGTFYWGGIWIPVGSDRTTNMALWEKYGSGWASSFAAPYDPEVGESYGGSSWDNQALFGFDGKALDSLATFRYLKYGTSPVDGVDYIPEPSVTIEVGSEFNVPEGVTAVFNDRNLNSEVPVVWDMDDVMAVDTSVGGEYHVKGFTEDGTPVNLTVKVEAFNYMANPSFEEEDLSMWRVSSEGTDPTDYQNNPQDAHSGNISLHYWSEGKVQFSVEQTVTGLEAGTYRAGVYSQGGDFSADAVMELYVVNGEETLTAPIKNSGWVNWQTPQIEVTVPEGGELVIGVRTDANPKAWGTLDDFELIKVG